MLRAAISILVAACLFWPLAGWIVSSTAVSPPDRKVLADQFTRPAMCQPEPGERSAFLAGIAFFPLSIALLLHAGRRWEGRLRLSSLTRLNCALEVELCLLLIALCCFASAGDEHFHIRSHAFFVAALPRFPGLPIFCLTCAAFAWHGRCGRLTAAGIDVLALAAVGAVVAASLFDESGDHAAGGHFGAVFDPMVRVQQGRALLIDSVNPYGLYPHFLQPLFAAWGLSVFKFTAVMALLSGVSLAGLWSALSRVMTNRLLALLGFWAFVFNFWFVRMDYLLGDCYFQYLPIRFVFPASLPLLAVWYFHRPGRFRSAALMIWCSAGVLWNLDSGLPTLLTWIAVLCFDELFAEDWKHRCRRCAEHVAGAAAALAAVMAAYTAAIFVRYGSVPDFLQVAEFQRLFYASGFAMLPLPLPGVWMLVVLVYLAGLAYAGTALFEGSATAGNLRTSSSPQPVLSGHYKARMVLLLSILGIGLFPYYQGRSHAVVLTLAWWPALLLIAIFLDELLTRIKAGAFRPLPCLTAGLLAWFLVGSAWSFWSRRDAAETWMVNNLTRMATGASTTIHEDAGTLPRYVPAGERALVLSRRDSLNHLLSEVPSLSRCPFTQSIVMDDFYRLRATLAATPRSHVLIDREIFERRARQSDGNRGAGLLAEMLADGKFEMVAATRNAFLFRGSEDRQEPSAAPCEQTELHVRFAAPGAAPGTTFQPRDWTPRFTLELVVKPVADETPLAILAGNQRGSRPGQGYFIRHQGAGRYALFLGNGSEWRNTLQFKLSPARWNHLAITADEQRVDAYLDGRPVASADLRNIAFANNDRPLVLGDSPDADRPFRGAIREIRILAATLTAEDFRRRAELRRGENSSSSAPGSLRFESAEITRPAASRRGQMAGN